MNTLSVSFLTIPHWLDLAMSNYHKGIKTVLSIPDLLRIGSAYDVAFYIFVNQHISEFMFPYLYGTAIPFSKKEFIRTATSSSRHINTDDSISSDELVKLINEIESNYLEIEMSYAVTEDKLKFIQKSLLGSPNSNLIHPSRNDEPIAPVFDLVAVSDEQYALRLRRAASDVPYHVQLHECVRDALRTLSKTYRLEELAKTPLFSTYVNMSKREAV